MTLLVHVAGNADLGIVMRLPHDEQDGIPKERIKELGRRMPPEELASRLLDMTYDIAREEAQCGVDVNPDGLSATPLANELTALAASGRRDTIRILVIGSKSGRGATEELAHALEKGIAFIRPAIEERYGLAVSSVESVILPSLFEHDWILPVEEKIGETESDERVVLPIAGGANSIILGIAGTVQASGRNLDLLLAKTDTPKIHSFPIDHDPIRGWLLGLGLPTLLEGKRQGDDEVREAAASVATAFSDKKQADRAEALGQLLLMDVARGDLAAGMSIRAWLNAEKARRQKDGVYCEESWKPLEDALTDAGRDATHDFASLMDDHDAETTRNEVRHAVGEENVPDFLSWPNEHVCLIYGIGMKSQQLERGEFAVEMMAKEPVEEFRLACGVSRPLRLDSIFLASSDSAARAHEAAEAINAPADEGDSDHPWAQGTAEVEEYGEAAAKRKTHEGLQELIDSVQDKVKQNLGKRKPRPRAIVVGTLGEKEVLLSALSAAQNYGAQWGIPVFLVSSVTRNEEEEFQFHRFGLGVEAKRALLTGARYCMDRLDLLSAQRLLVLGDHEMRERAESAKRLAEELGTAVNAAQLDDHAALIADVYRVIANRCASSEDEALRARLATIAGELIFEGRNQEEAVLLKRAKPGDFTVPSLEEVNLGQLLTMVYQVRSKTPLNHGQGTVDQALETVLGNRVQSVPDPSAATYSRLLERAAAQISAAIETASPSDHITAPSLWKPEFDDLHTWIQETLDA